MYSGKAGRDGGGIGGGEGKGEGGGMVVCRHRLMVI